MIRQAVVGAHRRHRHVGICGQAPSDFPDVARRLVEFGIDSISLTPDTVLHTAGVVAEAERLRAETNGLSRSADVAAVT
jgi:pyruvate,water dikinase